MSKPLLSLHQKDESRLDVTQAPENEDEIVLILTGPLGGESRFRLNQAQEEALRWLLLNQPARQAIAGLLAFLAIRGFSVDPSAPLLVVRQHRRISIRLVQQIVQQLREKCALDTPATPHSCRHYFATQLLEARQDVCSVSRLLGHTRVQTTMIYQHATPEHLADTVRALETRW